MEGVMKKVAIVQPLYIPWKGYFDLINVVDEFVIYDETQYQRRSWQSRNKLKTSQGLKWLSIPIDVKKKYDQKINKTFVSDQRWAESHWKTISNCYSKAKFFKELKPLFEEFYLNNTEKNLCLINLNLIKLVCSLLGIKTKITRSSDYVITGDKTEKLLNICRQASADVYISGPAARHYFDETVAMKMGVSVEWMDYSSYPEYSQLFSNFEHNVTILDLIFNVGTKAPKYMKSFNAS
jgi:hypothetical protein